MYGLIEFGTETDEEQQAIAASLDTVCGTFGDGADLAAALAKSWALREGRTRVTVYQQGGGARPTSSAAELIDRVLRFGDAVPGRAVAPYSILLGDYGQLSPLAAHPVDLAPARRALSRAVRIRDEILTQLEDIDYYLSHAEQFQPISEAARTAIEEAHRTLARQLDDVTRAASRCASTARGCVSTVDYPGYGLPDRRGVLTMPRPSFARPIAARPTFAHAGRLLAAGAATS